MTDINQIITEWTYRLDSGYPTKDSDYDVLQNVLQELTELEQPAIQRIVRRARGLEEAPEQNLLDIGLDPEHHPITSEALGMSEQEFIQYIEERYLSPGQIVKGLGGLYNRINKLDPEMLTKVSDIILDSNAKKTIADGQYSMTAPEVALYSAITPGVTVTNGHPSELWFAIIYNGLVAGAVGGKDDIESDVIIGNDTLSLKAYTNTTFDLGTLPGNAKAYLTKFIALSELLLDNVGDPGQAFKYEYSMSANEINDALRRINDPKMIKELNNFLNTPSDIGIIEKLKNQLRQTLMRVVDSTYPEKIDKVDDFFCDQIDAFIREKINKVSYWGFILTDNKTVFIRSSATVTDALTSKIVDGTRQLSPAITNFRQGKLFIKGSGLIISKRFTGEA
tara:strand:+ start:1586 stop:2764 length:1179 start_codon:yes stop_codon:yes gene_type:complete